MREDSRGAGLSTPLSTADGAALPYRRAAEAGDVVIQPLDEPEGHLVLDLAVGGDPLPMSVDHLGEFLVRRESLPLQARAPVLEEFACPALALLLPQLPEGFL